VFRDGDLGLRAAGTPPAAALDELLQKVRELDMDAVRAKVAAAETAASA
jgi:thioredoxin 1